MNTRTVFLLAALLLLPVTGSAQVGNLLKKGVSAATRGATRAVEKQISKEIEKAAEKTVNEAFERARIANGDTAAAGGYFSGMGSGGSVNLAAMGMGFGEVTLKHDEDYKFSGRIVMEIESFDDDGSSEGKVLYTMLYNNNNLNSAIEFKDADPQKEDGTALFLFDYANQCFFMLSEADGSKSGMIMAIPEEPATEPAEVEVVNTEFEETYLGVYKKTGRSKTISGYKCDEYLAKDTESDDETSVWITRDATIKINQKGMATAGIPAWYSGSALYGGHVMEMESRENGKVTSTMVTKEINDNINTDISIKGYELVQLNSKM